MNYETVFLEIAFLLIVSICNASDFFEGFLQQSKPCFELVHHESCSIPLTETFSPPYKGVNSGKMDTKIYLFTTKNPNEAEPLSDCGGMLPSGSDFNRRHDTVVIVHGGIDGVCRTSWMREIKSQLFKRGNYNIILVDWTWGNLDVASANVNTIVVGQQLGFVIKNILKQRSIARSKIHLIGHSFGVFVTNQAAIFLRNQKRKSKIRRMTWLDPPSFGYIDDEPLNRLKPENAEFTDVIHSGGGVCFPFRVSGIYAVGHVDFFPNGGRTQLSCHPYTWTSLAKGDIVYGLVSLYPPLCYHLQSIQFFKVSINPPDGLKFIGAKCDSYDEFESGACKRCCSENSTNCAVAGMDAEFYFQHKGQPRELRKYYFDTDLDCPYQEKYDFSIFKDCNS